MMEELLIIALKQFCSIQGGSTDEIKSLFGITDYALQLYTGQIITAILKLKDRFIVWPDAKERRDLVSQTMHELPFCIGYAGVYKTKFADHTLKIYAVCDYKLRFRDFRLDWSPDNETTLNCQEAKKSTTLFSGAEWLAANNFYKLTKHVISPFNEDLRNSTFCMRRAFNERLNKYQGRIDACFKEWIKKFESLKELPTYITHGKNINEISRWIYACAILHNIYCLFIIFII